MFIVHNKHQAQTDHQRKSQKFRYGCDKKSNHTGLQNQVPWGFSVPLPDPQVGNSVVGPRTFLTVEHFFGIIVLQFVGRLLYGSVVGLMATSSKRAYATCCVTQVCCTQSSCLCGRPLLTHTSAGDTQTLKGRSGSVSVGSLGTDVQKILFEPSKCLWQVWGLILGQGTSSSHQVAKYRSFSFNISLQ